jgi:bla regulator protein blaR1
VRYFALTVVVLCSVTADARQEAVARFDVASVRKHTGPPPTSVDVQPRPGAYRRVNITAHALMLYAYDVADYQVLNMPAWARSDRFDVEARSGRSVNAAETRLMVRSLLEDRFALRVHDEKRQMATYSVVLASAGGKLGPNLKPNSDDCKSNVSAPANAPAGAVRVAGCGGADQIASLVSRTLGAPATDQTGLTGFLEYAMFYSPDGDAIFGRGTTATRPDNAAPHFSTALQEQLGLKLESSRGQVDVIMIDRIERPIEN